MGTGPGLVGTGPGLVGTGPGFVGTGSGCSRSWLAGLATLGKGVAFRSRPWFPKSGHGGGHDLRAGRHLHGFKCGYLGDMPPHPLATKCFSSDAGSFPSGTK